MARWRAERWKCHPYEGEELIAYVSGESEEYANEWAIKYVETLQEQGFEVELVENGDVRAMKGTETFIVRTRKMEG